MAQINSRIGAIILAAGKSTRMGKPKLLLMINKKPVFLYVCEIASELSLDPTILIGGRYTQMFQPYVQGLKGITTLYNAEYEKGMSTSLKLGIDRLIGRVDAAIIFLADQPLVSKSVVQSMIKCYERGRSAGTLIVRPNYEEVVGHPVLVSSELFSEFKLINGDEGGKRIIKKYKQHVKSVSFNNPYLGMDIDTPDDFSNVKNYFENYMAKD